MRVQILFLPPCTDEDTAPSRHSPHTNGVSGALDGVFFSVARMKLTVGHVPNRGGLHWCYNAYSEVPP